MFERLKYIPISTKYLIHGFIRKCQTELFGEIAVENPYYNIPPLINNYCLLFYEIFTWYRKKCGDGIEFLSDTEVKVNEFRGWTSCIIGSQISNKICDKFSITFKIKSFGDGQSCPTFDIGYVTADSLEIQ